MKAIVLAAGYGTRLQPLTNNVPKPLVQIVGTPLISHIIMKLKKCGVSQIGVNTHHNAHMVKEFLSCKEFGLPIQLSHERRIMGVSGGIGGFRDFLSGEDFFMIHNGDILSNIPLKEIVDKYASSRALCSMILHDQDVYNNVTVDENDNIVDIGGRLGNDGMKNLAYTGIAFMDCGFLKYIPDGPSDLVPLLLDIIKKEKGLVRGIVLKNGNGWRDIGSTKSYFEAHHDILLKRKQLIDKTLIPDGPVFIGRGTQMEDGVSFDGFVSAGRNVLFGKGCRVNNCVIWDDAVIEQGAVLQNAIIAKEWIVNAP